jgi:hypothetical protein
MTHPAQHELLAYLDGEVGLARRVTLGLHLLRCWHCRAACAALEIQAHRFSNALAVPGPAAARQRFEVWRWRFEQEQPTPRYHVWWRYAWPAIFLPLLLAIPGRQVEELSLLIPHPAAPRIEVAVTATRPEPARHSAARPDLALELDVHYRLHRLGVCAAEPVLITRKPDSRIEVSVVAPPKPREDEIRETLADLVTAKRIVLRITPAPDLGLAVGAVGAPAPPPLISQAMLESAIPARFTDFGQSARKVLSEADKIYASAWALKRHSELAVPPAAGDRAAFWLKHSMLTDHTKELQASLMIVRHELRPISRRSRVEERLRAQGVFELASLLNSSLQQFFQTDKEEELDAAAPGPDELWAALEMLEREVTRLQRATSASHPQSFR